MDVPRASSVSSPRARCIEHIGPIQVRDGDDGQVFGLRAEERHTEPPRDDPGRGLLFDRFSPTSPSGARIEADAEDGKDRATVSLTVDFLRPATPGDWIESRTRVERVGGTLLFADVSLSVEITRSSVRGPSGLRRLRRRVAPTRDPACAPALR